MGIGPAGSILPDYDSFAASEASASPTAVRRVAPGVNDAGMAEQSVRSGKYDAFPEKKIIPRFGKPEDIARAMLFLLGPDNYVTGQVLTVDGGLSLKR